MGYMIDGYDGRRNDWHFVNIAPTESAFQYKWRNRANVAWTLTATTDEDVFAVGEDCPWYKHGYVKMGVARRGDGSVEYVLGPYDEHYLQRAPQPSAVV